MPKLDPKQVQKELDSGQVWPVYWLYGAERMKVRELLKRIRKAAIGEGTQGFFPEALLEGTEADAATIIDAAQSPSLGGGLRFVVVRDAHAIKESEELAVLLGPKGKVEELGSVVVFIAKDLDGRKKFSKTLTEKAAVVSCEEVPEGDREAWIGYLSKRKGLALSPEGIAQLCTLDPWTLDIIDQELEKLSLAGLDSASPTGGRDGHVGESVFLSGALSFGAMGGAEAFLDAFFLRDLRKAMERVEAFADQPDEALPLLGLFAWNVRQVALLVSDREHGTRNAKINPYLAERFNRWTPRWKLLELERLQTSLAELDFGFKQTPLLPLGLWSSLILEFCEFRDR